jgi:hypothetical protein
MAVNLSPVGGVAAQFFTNTGAVLTGGKLFTYLAGTTTPAVAYTSSQGNVAWTNPIVLDAAGRVSGSGEIWLTDGIIYKFVLKDSNDVLIATYDNITGINSNSVAYTNQQQIVTATAGQTVFNLSISYQPGTNSLSVFVDGVNQYGPGAQYAYTETDSDTVTFTSGLHVGAEVKFTTTQQQGAGAVDASQVSYIPPYTDSIATNVEAKLAQYISVFDFMSASEIADVQSNTAAIDVAASVQTAIDEALAAKKVLYLPAGTYRLEDTLTISGNNWLIGDGKDGTKLECRHGASCIIASAWGGRIAALSIYTYEVGSNAIQAGNNSRNCCIDAVYLDATAIGATTDGAGIYLYEPNGFSGGITISNSYAIQFKFGILMDGANLSTATWTTASIYNFWTVGYVSSGTPRVGTRGIYMSSNTNGIGTCMYGGTIEAFEYAIYVADDSYGGVFETDMENNTNEYYIGNAFQGHITSAFGVPNISRTSNIPTQIWEYKELIGGAGPKQENYYAPSWLVYDGGGAVQKVNYYRNDVSVIDGGSLQANATKFAFGLGQSGSFGSSVHPSDHYMQVSNSKLHWGNDIPSARTGSQLVAWTRGDVCYNLSATVGQPIGWMCTVSGTPGTWVAMANL